ncbi:MAG: 2-succinyl-5-enolpyruvyl-6-hydroxy-3-cyclohexene-1-carboxylic-acid synthase [Melioribacteraceae bacterium]|nr:2-succinyl-5-enolpyruvyl-6-hydroxy-3-cyclohexene-1-carboxylic-acid synthase [Melioribacteraceae bacterium]
MIQKINRNYLFSQIFASQLADLGITNAVVSPGSRNTPLTLAFADNPKIDLTPIIDERSAGFFALGITKKNKRPTVVITTSGTAVAELYPAIIEAYQLRIPLIILTADRPNELQNCGSNQTINQKNIFKNHIVWFFESTISKPDYESMINIKRLAAKAFVKSVSKKSGPIHINFPFAKPLEPWVKIDTIEKTVADNVSFYIPRILNRTSTVKGNHKNFIAAAGAIQKSKKGIIICGNGDYSDQSITSIVEFAGKLNYPIFADGSSPLRFGKFEKSDIITNFNSMLRSKKFTRKFQPEIIIQFGNAPTSNILLDFFEKSNAYKILINRFNELKDPSRTTNLILNSTDLESIEYLRSELKKLDSTFESSPKWSDNLKRIDNLCETEKVNFLKKERFPSETKIVNDIIKAIPSGCNLFVSNSMPIRDFDYFASSSSKEINLFNNRGASGIDGIISTALGIAKVSENPTILVSGDLSFYHNISAMQISNQERINLTVILINNGGGGIFNMLPVSKENPHFEKYFHTPHGLEFSKIIEGFGAEYLLPNTSNEFTSMIRSAISKNCFSVIDVKTDAAKSATRRRLFFKQTAEIIDRKI